MQTTEIGRAIDDLRQSRIHGRSISLPDGLRILYQRIDRLTSYDDSARDIVGIRTFADAGRWAFVLDNEIGRIDVAFFDLLHDEGVFVPITLKAAPRLTAISETTTLIEIVYVTRSG